MLTLFHAPRSRSTRFIWLLEELGCDYGIEYVSVARQDGSGGPDPKNPHPAGQVPAIVHEGTLVTESAAIAAYLTDAFPANGVGPTVGDPLRGPYLTWLAYYAGVMEPAILHRFRGSTEAADIKAYEELDTRWRGTLARGPWLLGERFSAADCLFTSLLTFARQVMPADSAYDDYLARAVARPAFARAMQKDAEPA